MAKLSAAEQSCLSDDIDPEMLAGLIRNSEFASPE
jgi:hypothetical protein